LINICGETVDQTYIESYSKIEARNTRRFFYLLGNHMSPVYQ